MALSLYLPDGQILGPGNPSTLEISPDGSLLAFVSDDNSRSRVYVRELRSFEARALAGTEGATSIFFSPDGGSIGFHANGASGRSTWAVASGHGSRRSKRHPLEPSWGEDDTILYRVPDEPFRLQRVAAADGTPTEIPLVLDSVHARPNLPIPTRQIGQGLQQISMALVGHSITHTRELIPAGRRRFWLRHFRPRHGTEAPAENAPSDARPFSPLDH